jgi:DNA-binding CsgD family transcriptional regulator
MRGASVAEVLDHVERASADGRLVAEEGSDSLTLWSVVGCLSWADELDRAEALIELALADARERGLALAQAQCLYARSWPRLWRGDVDGTVADAQFAVRVWEGGWGYYLPAAIHWLVRGEIERDDLDAAERSLTLEGGEERWGATTMYVLWRHARASVLAARGRHDAALAEFLECGRSVTEEFGLPNPAILAWRSSAALSAVALGRDDEARALAREELELARAFGAARPIGIALRALGLVERGTAGVAHLREAVAVLEPSAARLELARALVDLGMLLRIGGSPRAAREPLRRALDELSRMSGAHALRRRAEAELATAGGRPRRPALTGADALTPAERRVAELAAAGLSNPEIAQELFVARKTVEWHLGNVYAKLEVSSRDEIAAAIGGAPSGQSVSPTV